MKVKVNNIDCIGCGLCTSLCEAFAMDDDGTAKVDEAVAAENADAVNDAAASCPVGAIDVED